MIDFSEDLLSDRLAEYQHYDNCDRVHGLMGKTSIDRKSNLASKTPFWDEVEENYDSSKELIRTHDYAKAAKIWKLI